MLKNVLISGTVYLMGIVIFVFCVLGMEYLFGFLNSTLRQIISIAIVFAGYLFLSYLGKEYKSKEKTE